MTIEWEFCPLAAVPAFMGVTIEGIEVLRTVIPAKTGIQGIVEGGFQELEAPP